ncbi:MAG: hypothetical protein AAFZ18_30935, partial [Myxococcota bacterium]
KSGLRRLTWVEEGQPHLHPVHRQSCRDPGEEGPGAHRTSKPQPNAPRGHDSTIAHGRERVARPLRHEQAIQDGHLAPQPKEWTANLQ